MPSVPPPLPARLDPEWLAHRYDTEHDAIQFVRADRALRRSIPFLIDEHLPGAAEPVVADRAQALALSAAPAPLHFVFHSAYCCSTLLAAALDIPGVSTAYKEPQILNDLVGWRHRGGPTDRIGLALDGALHLLSRPFAPGEACVVKPSNVVNGLAAPILTMRPAARAILLSAPLRVFLTSIARKGMWGRLWVRELFAKQLDEGLIDLGFAPRDHVLQTDLQVAAVGWLAQHKLFAQLAARWPERAVTLDSEAMIAAPEAALAAVARHFGLDVPAADVRAVVADVFSRNAKDGSRFEAGQRGSDRASGEQLHGEEVDKVAQWAEAVAAAAGVAMTAPNPLAF